MTSQNRMNAGAEYVLYRIWATLQTDRGIHAESLLTCVGALAGYACQHYVREAGALSGLSDVTAQLVDSPLSLWALVSRAVLKLEQPLPDLQEIIRRTAQTSGSRAIEASGASEASRAGDTAHGGHAGQAGHGSDVPRLPEWHRPHQPAIVYLKQLWPQTLPIAQRFCKRPLQLPVLFGIALQRAIEHTKDLLSPTMAASIAMECAIAMSRVELPGAARSPEESGATVPPQVSAATTGLALPQMTARGSGAFADLPDSGAKTSDSAFFGRTTAATAPARALAAPTPTPRFQRKIKAEVSESGAARAWALLRRIPPAAHVATIGCLAFISTAGAMYNPIREEPIVVAAVQTAATTLAMTAPPAEVAQSAPEDVSSAETTGESQFPTADSSEAAETPPPTQLLADSSSTEAPAAVQTLPPGYDEGLMRDEYGQTMQ